MALHLGEPQPQAGPVDVVKLNVDENPRTAQRYGILHVPTMELFRDGEVVRQVVGARSKSALLREFAEFLEPAGSLAER